MVNFFEKCVFAIISRNRKKFSATPKPTNYSIFSTISFLNYQLSFQIRTSVFKSKNQSFFFSRSIWIHFFVETFGIKFWKKEIGKNRLKMTLQKFPLIFAPNFRAKNLRRIYPGKNRDLRGNQGITQPPRNPANRRPGARNGPENRENSDLAQHPA